MPNHVKTIIELKGRFLTADRQKHKYIKEQYPDVWDLLNDIKDNIIEVLEIVK